MAFDKSLIKRIEAQLAKTHATRPAAFDLSAILFPKQLPFGVDTSRQSTAVCTRRAGKTYGCAAKLLDVARNKPGCVALYVTLSRINAKRLLWGILKGLNAKHGLGGMPSEGELCLTMPNGSRVYLSGASDESEIEKFRGLALGIVLIDEAQSFPLYIEKLVDEVLAPALMDFAGQLVLVGTPGPVPIGYFYDACTSPAWGHHAWSVLDNPHIKAKSGMEPSELLADELKRRGVTADDPVIQREWFGRWVLDTNSLVFRWETLANGRMPSKQQHHVMGVDIGFDDADAIAVLGWSDASPELELVEEWVGSKQTVSALMARVQAMHAKYKPDAVVADTGGLGKKICEEIQERTGIPIEAADKQRKLEHIELLNDALRTGKFFAGPESRFAQDCMKVEWDRTNRERPKISERFHSDICFVAGTKIRVSGGESAIEDVRRGDMVWTRAGLRPCLASAQTGWSVPIWRLETVDGHVLEGTSEHPILTQRGWIPLRNITQDDMLTAWQHEKPLNGEGRLLGIPQKKASLGTPSMVLSRWSLVACIASLVAGAAKSLLGLILGYSVRPSAARPGMQPNEGGAASMTLNSNAHSVERNSCATNTQSPVVALTRVRCVYDTGRNADVFGLTVDGEHEYFAGGVTSRNCDAVLYAWMRCQQWLYVEPKKPAPRINSWEWREQIAAQTNAELEDMWTAKAEANKRTMDEEREQEQAKWWD
jgi:hypothetical protein